MNRFPPDWQESGPTIGVSKLVRLACLMEAAAPKPGNVHPGASFHDLTFADLVASAEAIEPVFRDSHERRVGSIILDAVKATRSAVGTNTNLGMILLLAPLAAVPRELACRNGIGLVLSALDAADCRDAYEAIRIANPGGLGTVDQGDVGTAPPQDLVAAMRLAADRDLIARQYTNQFADVLDFVKPTLAEYAKSEPMPDPIVLAHLATMAKYPDSLIRRKCGPELAGESAARARRLLAIRLESRTKYLRGLKEFDGWLRADDNRRNPGTTADMLAAALFVYLRDWSKP